MTRGHPQHPGHHKHPVHHKAHHAHGRQRRFSLPWDWAWLLPIGAFLLNSYFLFFDLPDILHPDEPTIVLRAVAMGTGDLNPHYFAYPTLWIYTVFLAQGLATLSGLAFGFFKSLDDVAAMVFLDPTIFFAAARTVCALLGAAAVWTLYRIGERVSPMCGWAAGAGLALFGPLVFQAHYATADVPMTFMAVLCLSACLRNAEKSHHHAEGRWYPAILAGLAASTKYNAAVLYVPVVVSTMLRRHLAGFHKPLARAALVAAAVMGLSLLAGSPYIGLDFPAFLRGLAIIRTRVIGVAGAGPFEYLFIALDEHGFLLCLTAVVGWKLWLRSPNEDRRRDAYVLLSFFAAYFCLIQLTGRKLARYYLPLAPVVFLGAGKALARLEAWLHDRGMSHHSARISAGLFAAGLLFHGAVRTAAVELSFMEKDASTLAKEWILSNIPTEAGTFFLDDSSNVSLLPDRSTLAPRLAYWRRVGEGKAKQLLRAYAFYLQEGLDAQGYSLLPTTDPMLNIFRSGSRIDADYALDRLERVRYVAVSLEALERHEHPVSSRFFWKMRKACREIHRTRESRRLPTNYRPGPGRPAREGKTVLIFDCLPR